METHNFIFIFLIICTNLMKVSVQIYMPEDGTHHKPNTYTSGIKTSEYRRPVFHHNYSHVYHQNSNSYNTNQHHEEDETRHVYQIHNAHTYGNRPSSHNSEAYVFDDTKIRKSASPARQIVIFNKEKNAPRIQIYKSCPEDATGQFVYESSCNQFLNCWKGRGYVQNCAPGTLFNPKTLECDFPEKVTCVSGPRQALLKSESSQKNYKQIGCPNGFTGLIPNYTDCSKFINCVSGIENFMDCPPGTLFDVNKNICDFAHRTNCFNGENQKSAERNIDGRLNFKGSQQNQKQQLRYRHNEVRCPEGSEGLYRHPTDCSKFINCANGETYVQSCAPGTLFNPSLKICDFPYNVRCQNSTDTGIYVVDYDAGFYQPNKSSSGVFHHRNELDNSRTRYGSNDNFYGTNIYGNGGHQGQTSYTGYTTNPYYNQGTNYSHTPYTGYNRGDYNQSPSYYGGVRNQHEQTGGYDGYGNSYYDTSTTTSTNSNRYAYNRKNGYYGTASNQQGIYGNSNRNGYDGGIPLGQESQIHSSLNPYGNNHHTQSWNGQDSSNNYQGGALHPKGSYYPNVYGNQGRQDETSWNRGYDANRQAKGVYYGGYNRELYSKGTYDQGSNIYDTNNYYNNQHPQNKGSFYNRHNDWNTQPYSKGTYHGTNDGDYWRGTQTDNFYNQRPSEFGHNNLGTGSVHRVPGRQDTYGSTNYGTNPINNRDRPIHDIHHQDSRFQQGARGETGYNRWPGREDDHITTTNYDQVVNINQIRRTTPVPFRNSYEPFYGTTAKSRHSNDYEDVYGPGTSRKYVRSTTPTMPEKNWPPPFPSTDVNADYVFEYEDNDTPEPEAASSKHTTCKDFLCSNDKCISKTLICNGIKDCPNGKDEEKCLDYVSRFSVEKGKRLAVLEKERWNNISIAACALLCVSNRAFNCRSFNYRKIDKTCFLSNTNEALTGASISYYIYDYYELISEKINCTDLYVCNNKKCINRTKICDGEDDCGDRMDEKGCKSRDFGYSIRLTGSKNKNEGQIEVTAFGRTGYVCDDTFGLRDGNVVCKELGFHLGAAEVKGNSYFAKNLQSEKPFYMMDDVTCVGNETRLMDCDFSGWGVHNCLGREIAGVVCKTPTEKCASDYWQCDTGQECLPLAFVCDGLLDCTDGSDEGTQHCDAPTQIRLVNGTNSQEGRVEIRHNGIWGTICDDDFNEDAAKVVCRQLSYRGAAAVKKEGFFGSGSGPIWLDQVFCTGNETGIEHCSHWNWGEHNCEHGEDVGIVCSNTYEYVERHSSVVEEVVESTPQTYPERCGHRSDTIFNNHDNVHFRVVKGSIAKKGDYPWQAAIRVKGKTGTSHWCGAVIISEKFVLTAAHCLIGYSKGAYVVVAGDYNVDEIEGTEQEVHIEDYYLHENFRQGHKMNNDIALVKLKGRGFRLNQEVQAICLPDADANYDTNLNCTISGFGSIESGKSAFSHDLRAGWIPLQKREICKMPHVYGDALTDGMICAGSLDEGIDSCDGDSGGPLACLDGGVFTLYGITSWGQHCGYANKPGVYVKVAHYRKWIDDNFRRYSVK